MPEETKPAEVTAKETQTTAAPASEEPTNYREGYVKGLETQLKKAQKELEGLLNREREAKEQAEKDALEKSQNIEGLKAKYESELAEVKAQAEHQRIRSDLALAGVHDAEHAEFLAMKFKASDSDDLATWIAETKAKENMAVFFGVVQQSEHSGAPAVPGGAAASRSKTQSLEERLNSKDPAVASAAKREYLDSLRPSG